MDGLSNSTDETGPAGMVANPQDGTGMVYISLDPAVTGREWKQWNGTGFRFHSRVPLYYQGVHFVNIAKFLPCRWCCMDRSKFQTFFPFSKLFST